MTTDPPKPPGETADTPTDKVALAGVRVLDFSRVLAGPYCSMVLADYGAEIIKVERPGMGDDTRQWGPPWIGGEKGVGESAYFLSVNRSKHSITLDLKRPAGQALARRLAAKSDVVIENFKPGTAAELGIGYQQLSNENPALVYCSISGYGQDGPYRDHPGYDFMIQAEGGLMSITGPSDGSPHKVGVAMVDISTGLFATTAILAALHSRQVTGLGQQIDVSLFESQIACLANVAQSYLCTRVSPQRYGNQHPNIVPYQTLATADGVIAIAVGNDRQYLRFCSAISHPELGTDPRFSTNDGRVTHRHILIPMLEEIFRGQPTTSWVETLLAAQVPVSPVNDIPAAFAHPQVEARGAVKTVHHETLGDIDMVAPVARFSNTPTAVPTAPPVLGANTHQILQRLLGLSEAELDELDRQEITASAPTGVEKAENV